MIEVKSLKKKYGSFTALDDLSFSVKRGEIVGFLGPNGAGKSSTMKILTGFMSPSSGEVKINGLDVFEHPKLVKKQIGYLPEQPPVYTDLSVDQFLKFVADLKLVEKAKISSNIEEAIERLSLGDVRKRLIGHLSKGFRQRVGIAQALVSKPKLLVLDEPTVGLDPKQVTEMRSVIKNLQNDHTVLLSTHILSEVQATCQRVIIIDKGKIVASDSIKNIMNDKRGQRRLRIKVARYNDNLVSEIKNINTNIGITVLKNSDLELLIDANDQLQETIAKRLIDSGYGLLELVKLENSLEDVFIDVTSDKKKEYKKDYLENQKNDKEVVNKNEILKKSKTYADSDKNTQFNLGGGQLL